MFVYISYTLHRMKPVLSIVIINYNSKHYLQKCLDSVFAQKIADLEVIFIDNASEDGSFEFVEANYPDLRAIRNGNNLGYAAAGNQGIKMAEGEYVMILNPDILFEAGYMEACLKKMQEDRKVGVIGGKVYKYDFEKDRKTKYIDTVGIFSHRNRRFIDDGQGLLDQGQFDQDREIFGVSGACPIYRKKSLEDVKIGDEYLDEDFFMYKEDVDISWRLRLYGWKCYYLSGAIAYHGRGTGVLKRFSHLEVARNRSKLSKFQKYYSYKNQRLMQVKNEFFSGFVRDLFPIVWKEVLVTGYIVFREPHLIKAWLHLIKQLPAALKKRQSIMKNAKVNAKEMQRWLSNKQSTYLKTK